MMREKNYIKLLILLFFAFLANDLLAQVTIGSTAPPEKGALIQLKDDNVYTDNKVNASKGFLLPRVQLVKHSSLLPFQIDANPVTKQSHTGLMVYNVTENLNGYINGSSGATDEEYIFIPGVYIWDGTKWVAIKYAKTLPANLIVICPTGSTITQNVFLGETLSYNYFINYTSSAAVGSLPAFAVADNGVTVSYPEHSISLSGQIPVQVNGKPLTTNNINSFIYDVNVSSFVCPFYINVRTLTQLTCPASPAISVLEGAAISQTITIPYTGGYTGTNAKILAYEKIVNDVKVTVNETILSESGNISVTISGTPSATGTFSIPLDLIQIDDEGLTNEGKGASFAISCSLDIAVKAYTYADLPNSYFVKPGETLVFPLKKPFIVWNDPINTYGLLGQWTYAGIGESLTVNWTEGGATITAELTKTGEMGSISVTAGAIEGNAHISYVVDGAVRWSWHIWVTNYAPDANDPLQETVEWFKGQDGSIIMDRNLGATSESDPIKSRGFFYQWGRKDPMPYTSTRTTATIGTASLVFVPFTPLPQYNSIENAGLEYKNLQRTITEPTSFGRAAGGNPYDWYTRDVVLNRLLWNKPDGTPGKGYFDPCPHGWKVPQSTGVWARNSTDVSANDGGLNSGTVTAGSVFLSQKMGYYPYPGYMKGGDGQYQISGPGYIGNYLTATTTITNFGGINYHYVSSLYMQHNSTFSVLGNIPKGSAGSVRCVQDN